MTAVDLSSVSLLHELFERRRNSGTPPKLYSVRDIRLVAGALVLTELAAHKAVRCNSTSDHSEELFMTGEVTGDSFLDSVIEEYPDEIEFSDFKSIGEEALKVYGSAERQVDHFVSSFSKGTARTYGEKALISVMNGDIDGWNACTVLQDLVDVPWVRVKPWVFAYTAWGSFKDDFVIKSTIQQIRNYVQVSLSGR